MVRGSRLAWGALIGACALGALLAALGVASAALPGRGKAVVVREPAAPVLFAAGEVRRALEANGFAVDEEGLDRLPQVRAPVRIVLAGKDSAAARRGVGANDLPPTGSLKEQGYAIRTGASAGGTDYWVLGADPIGTMYGGLDLAERIRTDRGLQGIAATTQNPYHARRGIKLNIPLDARTPSYDDTGDSAQENYATMWDFSFWQDFLDEMARHRYNTLTLWNPHPFPSLVKLPDYPDVALDDVCVTTLRPTWKPGAWREPMFVFPEVFRNLKVVRRMTMDEKVAFWRRVMEHAASRGIDVYFVTWNVIVNAAEGKYGITAAQDNPKTIAYLRECVRECLLAYPLLAGIGVTAGENMQNRRDEFSKEKWLWNTYGLGVLDARARQPGRQVRFLHRDWQTGVDEIVEQFASRYPDEFRLEFKYAHAHVYSSTKPPFAERLLREMKPYGLACWWNLRNDDIFNFRWGDPDYVRQFLLNLPEGQTAGYYLGSDGYVWGREFTSLEPDEPRALEIRKHWYSFMLWGRLGYDPKLDRRFFLRVLAARFPEAKDAPLYDAWAAASKIVPRVNRFHWRDWDFLWAVEGCMDAPKGFHTVDDFITVRPMPASGMISIPEYVDGLVARQPVPGTTPVQVAAELESDAQAALDLLGAIRKQVSRPGKELRQTLGDIEAMAHLGRYYAAKIRGAVELHSFRRTKDPKRKEAAIAGLREAVKHWQRYAAVAAAQYRPQLLARTRQLDWLKALEDVKKDVEIAEGAAAGLSEAVR